MPPCFLQLSDEIVLLIFEQVTHISPRSLLDLCLVSKKCCTISSSLLYRSLSLSSHNAEQLRLAGRSASAYTFRANMLAYSRHLTVNDELDWAVLAKSISRMTRLESIRWLYWDDPFPNIIKKCLQQSWPDTKLFIEALSLGFQTDVDEVQIIELNLLKSLVDFHNIDSIKVVIEYENPVAMRGLKDVLLSSPNLRILHLTLPRNRDGKIEWLADASGAYDLCIQPGERLGPLTELVLETRKPPESDKSIIPASFFDFTLTRRLELRGFNLDGFLLPLTDLSLHLEQLTILHLNRFYEERDNTLENFISSVRGVECLRIIIYARLPPISTIFVFRETLKTLELRLSRQAVDSYPLMTIGSHVSYSPGELNDLRDSCPQISSLTLEMVIDDILPYDFLDALAKFPQLSSLRLYFDFNAHTGLGRQTAKPPHISADRLTAIHLFSYLRDRKVGVTLEKLELMMSDRPLRSRRVDFWQLSDHDRPSMLFTCREDSHGKPVVEHDPYDDEDVSWWSYFDPNKPKTFRGQTYPDNLLDIIEAGKEASKLQVINEYRKP